MSALHDPDPEFLEHLAWQTRTLARRVERFGPTGPTPRKTLRGWLHTPALVLVSVVCGAAGVVGADHLRTLQEQELLLAGVEVRLDAAALRRDHAREQVTTLRALHEAGLAPETEVASAEADLVHLEAAVQRIALERDEIEASGHPPRDELSAPIVQGRDFVTERLVLAVHSQEASLDVEQRRLARAEALLANGLVSQTGVDAARLGVARAEQALSLLGQRIELRAEFLSGEVTGERVELLALRAEALGRAALARTEVDRKRGLLSRLEIQVQAGIADPRQAEELRVELREAEAALELAQLELERIRARSGD